MMSSSQTQKCEQLYQSLLQKEYPVFRDIPLAPFTAFATGGNADLLLLPRRQEELFCALELCEQLELPLSVLGGGANVLVSDAGIRGAVLSLRALQQTEWRGWELQAEAGWDMSALCRAAARRSAGGLHYFYGMPGSLGGALYMNARCYGGEISQLVQSVLCIPRSNKGNNRPNKRQNHSSEAGPEQFERQGYYRCSDLQWVELSTLDWDYKYSHFQRDSAHRLCGALIVAARLQLREQSRESLEREMQNFLEDRIVKGHFRAPCGGSFFKNNRAFGAPTGQLIDSLGLKGTRLGRAQLAPWHGNIIINTGWASAAEIWGLACRVRRAVELRMGFMLEAEIQRLGEWAGEKRTQNA